MFIYTMLCVGPVVYALFFQVIHTTNDKQQRRCTGLWAVAFQAKTPFCHGVPCPACFYPPFRVILPELLIQCLLDRLHSLFKKEGSSLISYFLYLCQLGFTTALPRGAGVAGPESLFQRENWTWTQKMTNTFISVAAVKAGSVSFKTRFFLYVLNQNGFFSGKTIRRKLTLLEITKSCNATVLLNKWIKTSCKIRQTHLVSDYI